MTDPCVQAGRHLPGCIYSDPTAPEFGKGAIEGRYMSKQDPWKNPPKKLPWPAFLSFVLAVFEITYVLTLAMFTALG